MIILIDKILFIFTSHWRELEFVEAQDLNLWDSLRLEFTLLSHQSKVYDNATLNYMHKAYLYWLGEVTNPL